MQSPDRASSERRPRVVAVDAEHPAAGAIADAAEVLRSGGLVAFPTETVYGLGCRAHDAAAVARVYAAKGRPATNPLIAHVADASAARALAAHWPEVAERLAAAFWPGPLTLVVERAADAPTSISAGLTSLAVRVPRAPVALALLRALGEPIAAPSANPSGRLSPTRAEHVVAGLAGRVDLVLDGGPCTDGLESAVVDVRGATPRLLRPGTLHFDALARVAPGLARAADPAHGAAHASPGQGASHYAPRAPLEVLERSALAMRAAGLARAGLTTARLVRAPLDAPGDERALGDSPTTWSRDLYAALHALDATQPARILVEAPPTDAAWLAVADRLRRASAPRGA